MKDERELTPGTGEILSRMGEGLSDDGVEVVPATKEWKPGRVYEVTFETAAEHRKVRGDVWHAMRKAEDEAERFEGGNGPLSHQLMINYQDRADRLRKLWKTLV